jgi:hypothetical protein
MVLPLIIGGIMLGYYLLKENKKDTKNITNNIKSISKKSDMDLSKQTYKQLVQSVKGDSKDWHDWNRNEKNEKFFEEMEIRNNTIEKPKFTKVSTVFRDDPNAIKMQKVRIENFENELAYWKKINKFPARDYSHKLGDKVWYSQTSASTNLRNAKKKLAKLETDKKSGVKLERKNTFTTGKKRFYYKESS